MAIVRYDELFWTPDGSIAAGVQAVVYEHDTNTKTTLWADASGTVLQANPLNTDADGRLTFFIEEGAYWLHLDSEAFELLLGSAAPASTTAITTAVATHNAATANVHGIPDTATLETQAGAQQKADAAQADAEAAAAGALSAHAVDTTAVHGIPDTGVLETQSGAQSKATAAQSAAESTAASALGTHAADTTAVHGIANTAALATGANVDSAVAAHSAATTAVHGIVDTARLAVAEGWPRPSDYGYRAWAYDPATASSAAMPTGGALHLVALRPNTSGSSASVHWGVSVAGVTPTAGANWVGLYDSSGVRLAQAGVDGDLTSTGLKTTLLVASLSAGALYWVGLLLNASTLPQVFRSSGQAAVTAFLNGGLTADALRFASNGAALTTLPSSIVPGSNVPATAFWAAIK
ncbi:hypothetical protein [Streptomyces iconiensis]|uniref:Uncharacterized protein n=1 Tax=Streptomyces iconiensis TaxID=1384038 RepID=A0ABT7ABD4_9ACTN|nr:hypothetical protein [Streptomyces iconiensis]MDJ1137923.1 hypothetical protein [Streptomyces iconiensis]